MINLTWKQEIALQNLEAFLGIWSNRVYFETKEELDEYFTLLKKKCNKKERQRNKIKEMKDNGESYEISLYSLKKYALRYNERYSPTIKKLEEKLRLKTKNEDNIKEIIEEFSKVIDEEKLIDSFIRNENYKYTNVNKLKTKLYNKGFSASLIKSKLEDLDSVDSLFIQGKIMSLIYRNKSRKEILYELSWRENDRETIDEILEREYSLYEEEIYKNEYNKYMKKYNDKYKVKQKMFQRGFYRK